MARPRKSRRKTSRKSRRRTQHKSSRRKASRRKTSRRKTSRKSKRKSSRKSKCAGLDEYACSSDPSCRYTTRKDGKSYCSTRKGKKKYQGPMLPTNAADWESAKQAKQSDVLGLFGSDMAMSIRRRRGSRRSYRKHSRRMSGRSRMTRLSGRPRKSRRSSRRSHRRSRK